MMGAPAGSPPPPPVAAADAACLPDGYRLLEYQIERPLGGGGFGITYLARDINLNNRNHYFLGNRYSFFRIFNKLVAQMADVHQAILVNAYIYKRSESGNVRYDARHFHTNL